MILKMKLINLVGLKANIDKVIEDYLLEEEIEFINPLSVFKSTRGFTPSQENNPYEDSMRRFTEVFDYAGINYNGIKRHKGKFSAKELDVYINKFDEQIHSLKDKLNNLAEEKESTLQSIKNLEPITGADVQLESLADLKFLKFRFGKMPEESYELLEKYLADMPVYYTAVKKDKGTIWGFYFAAADTIKNIDHIFATLYFERIRIETKYSGTPQEIIKSLEQRIAQIDEEYEKINLQMKKLLSIQKDDLFDAYASIKYYYDINKIKKFAVYTQENFYFTFWADKKTSDFLTKKSDDNPDIKIVIEEPESIGETKVPTKLKNNILFRPFEDFVKMYGVPAYNEIDPTPLFAIVYTLLFGMMFGDLGHGLMLLAFGIILTALKKGGFLAKILIPLGVSSSIFGVLYGTCFGFEGSEAIIKPLWFTPMEDKTRILLITVGIGVAIILICMFINIINGIRQRDWHKVLFSQNGAAGILFYVLALYTGLSVILNSKNPSAAVIILIIISLLVIFMQEPLTELLKKKKNWMPKEKGSFFVQSFFELFEILLSFITNSMSFVRVGAFALNHAGMMSVVIMFMHQMNGAGNIVMAVLGNLLVIGLEGLIVGIQVLRLGFYEMFSRFYDGSGRLFKPNNN